MRITGRLRSWLRHALPLHRRVPVPLAQARLVVVDVETTGLKVRRDPLLAIGAVVVEGLRLDLGQQFERNLRADTTRVRDNILIHGLAPSDIMHGEEAGKVLSDFVDFAGDSPLLAFRAGFDRQVLRRACRRHFGQPLRNRFIDIAELAPALFPDLRPHPSTLDAWLEAFDLSASARHHAAADALATAELLLVLLHAARRQGIRDLDDLSRKISIERRYRLARGGG